MNKHAYSFSVFVSSPTEFYLLKVALRRSGDSVTTCTRYFGCLLLKLMDYEDHVFFHISMATIGYITDSQLACMPWSLKMMLNVTIRNDHF